MAALGSALLAAGCLDMDVENLVQPDRERALAEAADLEALIGGTFGVFFDATHNTAHIVNLFPVYGAEMTGVPVSGGGWSQSSEPRPAYENSASIPGDSGPWGPRFLWADLSQTVSNVNDGLFTMAERGITLMDGGADVTPRARAFAKLMQGWAWGYMGMLYDRAIVVPETEPVRSDAIAQANESLRPWEEVVDLSIASLQEAATIAQGNSFTLPSSGSTRLWFGTPQPMTSDQLRRLANTLSARILVLSARTPQQRAQVDWAKVLEYTANGLTTDFEVSLAPSVRTSLLLQRAQLNAPGCASCYRLSYRLIGLADVSGAYQSWLATPLNERTRFDIVTPDRRITGETPKSNGSYTAYRADDNGFPAGRGLYFRSAYQWVRHERRGFLSNTGTAKMATVDENNLLRAEALLRTGDPDGAAALVNLSRTRPQTIGATTYPGLPPVTASGVPQGADCVPRDEAGACGSLLVALRYERMLELAALDAVRGYADSRGFGMLPDGSWLQAPIPGNELDVLGQEIYTFGGVGTEWGAVFAPVVAP